MAGATTYYYQARAIVLGTVFESPVASVLVNPAAAPEIGLSASTIDLAFDPTNTGTSSRTFQVRNTGSGTLDWTASADVPWITLSPASGSTASGSARNVSVYTYATGFPPGTYTGTITVTAAGASNSPQTVDVSVYVVAVTWTTPPPPTATSGDVISFAWNVSDGTSFRNQVRYDPVSPPGGGLTGLDQPGPAGTYFDTIVVPWVTVPTTYHFQASVWVANRGLVSPVSAMVVSPPVLPPLLGNPANLGFTTQQWAPAPALQTVTLTNGGTGSMVWDAVAAAPWLSVSPAGGTLSPSGSTLVTVSVDSTQMPPGTYPTSILFFSGGAGNSPLSFPVTLTVQPDSTAPTVTGVTSNSPDGTYIPGSAIDIVVEFSEPVILSGGNLLVTLDTGAVVSIAPFGPAGTATGIYSVRAADSSPDLTAVSPLVLGAGAVLEDQAQNGAASVVIPLGQNLGDRKDIVIDSSGPGIASVTSATPDGVYGPGAVIDVTVVFTEAVTLTGGDLFVTLDTGAVVIIGPFGPATSASGSYTVVLGDDSPDLTALSPLSLGAGAVLQNGGAAAVGLAIPAGQNLGDLRDIVVDTPDPSVTSVTSATPDGSYAAGALIDVTVTFSEPVTLTGGSLEVTLDTGAVVTLPPFGPAATASGTYTVGAGDVSPDLTASGPLTLTGGATLRDVDLNDTILTIPAGNTLGDLKDIVIDTVDPVVAITLPTTAATWFSASTPLALGGTATDAGGVASVTWDNPAAGAAGAAAGTDPWNVAVPLVPGVNVITVTAVDTAGNTGGTSITVVYDSVPPTLTIVAPGPGPVTTPSIILSGTASDNQGVVSVNWINTTSGTGGIALGTTAWTASVPLVPGTNVIMIVAWDEAGNATIDTVTVDHQPSDTTPPTVVIDTPTTASTFLVAATPVTVGGTASDDVGVTQVSWRNETTGTEGVAGGAASWSASVPLTEGANVITATAEDAAGNTFTASITIDLAAGPDASPPVVVIASPAPGVTATSPVALTGTASDNIGISSVTWSNAATGGNGVASGADAWSAAVPLAMGDNLITVTATDPSGNVGTATITMTFTPGPGDANSPVVLILQPASALTYATSVTPLQIQGIAADDVAVETVVWSNAATGQSGTASGIDAWSALVDLLTGTNDLAVTVYDSSGNTATATLQVTYPAPAGGGGGGGGGGGCGATGLEVVLLWGLFAMVRRRFTYAGRGTAAR